RHYERALGLWDKVPDAAASAPIDRVDALERAATAAAANDPPHAAALMEEAIASYDAAVDTTRAGLLRERDGRHVWMAGAANEAVDACREAVVLVPDQPPTYARARVLASLGQMLMHIMESDETLELCQDAVDVARAVGAIDVECHALDTLGVSTVYHG